MLVHGCSNHRGVIHLQRELCGERIGINYVCDRCEKFFTAWQLGKTHEGCGGRVIILALTCQQTCQPVAFLPSQ